MFQKQMKWRAPSPFANSIVCLLWQLWQIALEPFKINLPYSRYHYWFLLFVLKDHSPTVSWIDFHDILDFFLSWKFLRIIKILLLIHVFVTVWKYSWFKNILQKLWEVYLMNYLNATLSYRSWLYNVFQDNKFK